MVSVCLFLTTFAPSHARTVTYQVSLPFDLEPARARMIGFVNALRDEVKRSSYVGQAAKGGGPTPETKQVMLLMARFLREHLEREFRKNYPAADLGLKAMLVRVSPTDANVMFEFYGNGSDLKHFFDPQSRKTLGPPADQTRLWREAFSSVGVDAKTRAFSVRDFTSQDPIETRRCPRGVVIEDLARSPLRTQSDVDSMIRDFGSRLRDRVQLRLDENQLILDSRLGGGRDEPRVDPRVEEAVNTAFTMEAADLVFEDSEDLAARKTLFFAAPAKGVASRIGQDLDKNPSAKSGMLIAALDLESGDPKFLTGLDFSNPDDRAIFSPSGTQDDAAARLLARATADSKPAAALNPQIVAEKSDETGQPFVLALRFGRGSRGSSD